MPLYDHYCTICEKIFDEFAGINEEIIKCPFCGNDAKRMIGTPGDLWMCFGSSKPWPYKVAPHGRDMSLEPDGKIRK